MSRAFIKEDDGDPTEGLPERPLPPGPNYVTPRGLAQLEERARSAPSERDRRYYRARLESAILVQPGGEPDRVRFGAEVEVRGGSGEVRRFAIVGEDEASESDDLVSWRSPLAAAVLGAARGERVVWSRPAGEEPLEVVSIRYPAR